MFSLFQFVIDSAHFYIICNYMYIYRHGQAHGDRSAILDVITSLCTWCEEH